MSSDGPNHTDSMLTDTERERDQQEEHRRTLDAAQQAIALRNGYVIRNGVVYIPLGDVPDQPPTINRHF